jgi:ATP-dependent helicase YprA (DUF1998 family)
MALNPIVYTEHIVRSFLRYQLTAYPFADERLYRQMRDLLSLDVTRQSPLLKGPYISLSRPFREGAAVDDLIAEGVFHPHMRQRIPESIEHVYGHQQEAIRAIHNGRTTLISTGTGSGKTECFLYPIISRCLELKDEGAAAGISAVIVYPMNALAEDQLGRLRGLLAGTGITFGMYVGKTPEAEAEVTGIRLPARSSRADYEARLAAVRRERRSETVHPPEEICSRERMRTRGGQPRILLTNVWQLELLLTRQRDVDLFADARLDFLVFDEAHTFTGAQGAETACLIRRLRSFCGREVSDTVCVATSATIVDAENPDAARDFASRFFGVARDDIVTVGEAYEAEVWGVDRKVPAAPGDDSAAILASCVTAVDDDDPDVEVRNAYERLAGEKLPDGTYSPALHAALSKNELVYQLTDLLGEPRSLAELPEALEARIGRPVTESEILAWLMLGAAGIEEGRPLLRPVVHGFVRGISGAVVSFPLAQAEPRLWLAAEDEIEAEGGETKHHHFPVLTCTTRGQHYYVAFLKDFEFHGAAPGGGSAEGDGWFWETLDEAHSGHRVVLTDTIVGGSDDEAIEEDKRTASVFFCRHCGSAHPASESRCLHCSVVGEMVELHAIRQKADNPGYLTSCLSCGSNGRRIGTRYREPARPVRATNVADVHVLAQDMVHHAERQRLLVFCDNRQDAAFQAGWMKDHARRFRLRALMADGMADGPVSVGDLTHFMDEVLSKDESLSRALVPEVWQVVRREGSGGRHESERRKFLRIQVLREVAMSARQAIGLEPWGRMVVEYDGLDSSLPWIQQAANRLGLPPDQMLDGVKSVLDYLRRKRVLHDPDHAVFTKYWMDGDLEVMQGYLPQIGSPSGTKLRREPIEKQQWVTQWLSEKGDTTLRQIAKKWGVETDDVDEFLRGLFDFLVEREFLVPVTLKGSRGNPLPNVSGVYQVDADKLRMRQNHGVWRCKSCRRRTTRRTPHMKCPAWRCNGEIEFLPEDPDNYDLQLLDQRYSMLRPEEHTAMVPHDERERLENLFKGEGDAVNCFVATPTLEMGVDIGQLDSILMRNVPPLPANYWQRAGRAGRRHRMAVDMTYCRPVSHDRAYFGEPLKILAGRVDPPAFNLRNDLMVAKHAHATVITRLHQCVRDPARADAEREAIDRTLKDCLPSRVSQFLFDGDGRVRTSPFDLSSLAQLIDSNVDDLTQCVERAFRQGWPAEDAGVTDPAVLRRHVRATVGELEQVVKRLRARLRWAMEQIKRLNRVREDQGDLDPVDDALYKRCDKLIKRLKGRTGRTRREAEGYDDSNTYGVLAAEGFLPGYGLEVGSIIATAEIPFWRAGAMEFSLPRPPSTALREYVPGNLIYANGNRFTARHFHRDVDEQRIEMPVFEVSTERQAVKETNVGIGASGLGNAIVPTIAVCDVELMHQSHISDEEELRFQMAVSVYGRERDQHAGGTAYHWGEQPLHHRRGVRLRLVNVGASSAVERHQRFGYPVCTVCGTSVSPLSSDRQRDQFMQSHRERCGRNVEPVGFYADVTADSLSLPTCTDEATAYSVLEALRMAATRVVDMHLEDLQILVIGHVDREEVDGLLWDPMPGGSGLLDQMLVHFSEIVDVAREIVAGCPSVCESSCVDCLQTFRNSYYHRYLLRDLARESIDHWGRTLAESHPIPPRQPAQPETEVELPVNEAETRLRHLLAAAGFADGIRGEQIRLDRAVGTTTPDIIYRADHHEADEGVCIYLDGLSAHLHGNPETAARDREIRTWLGNNGYEVIEIAANDLYDAGAMTQHFRRLAGFLRDDQLRRNLRDDRSWFERSARAAAGPEFTLRVVVPEDGARYVTCVPLIPLHAAAGYFSEPQSFDPDAVEWVDIETHHDLTEGMFVAQVVGRSMEPQIRDGAYCLFRMPVRGTRQGKTVLVQLRDAVDPETGERYTVKRYSSEKADTEEGTWRHVKIILSPTNKDFDPIEVVADDEMDLAVVAELLAVIGDRVQR